MTEDTSAGLIWLAGVIVTLAVMAWFEDRYQNRQRLKRRQNS